MAKVRLKVLSSGRIPGYPCNGPILNPITVDETVAMRYINAGLDVYIWSDHAQDFVRCQARDMLDMYNDKIVIDSAEDVNHGCDETHPDTSNIITATKVKNTPSDKYRMVRKTQHQTISSDEPISYVEDYYYEEPDFGSAYEPAPVGRNYEQPPEGLIAMDEFEDK